MSDLDDILRYCEAATEGPWKIKGKLPGCRAIGPKRGESRQAQIRAVVDTYGIMPDSEDKANATFIARTDLPPPRHPRVDSFASYYRLLTEYTTTTVSVALADCQREGEGDG